MKNVGISDGYWYCQAQEREKWRSICSQSVELPNQLVKNVVCHVCSKSFQRECDEARHKCTVERSEPIQEQAGAVQCQLCDRWFRSRGGLAVHRCREDESAINRPAVNPQVPLVCGICGRQFRRSGDLKHHKCNEPQSDAVQCPTCQRWFKNTRGLTIHWRAKHQV